MGCKYDVIDFYTIKSKRFNRNIMGCKSVPSSTLGNTAKDLIGT